MELVQNPVERLPAVQGSGNITRAGVRGLRPILGMADSMTTIRQYQDVKFMEVTN